MTVASDLMDTSKPLVQASGIINHQHKRNVSNIMKPQPNYKVTAIMNLDKRASSMAASTTKIGDNERAVG